MHVTVPLKMNNTFKIENKQLVKWCYEKEASGLLKKQPYIMAKIKEIYNYNCHQMEKISQKLNKVFFPHLKSRMKVCRYDKKEFERKNSKFLNNFFVVRM